MAAKQGETWEPHAELCRFCDDCTSCWAVFCCGCITTGQLYEKVLGPAGACSVVFGLVLVLVSMSVVLQFVAASDFTPALLLVYLLGWALTIVFVCVTCAVRARLRARAGVPVTMCNAYCCADVKCKDEIEVEDFCCALWCTPCVQCSAMRHVGISGAKYSLTSATGERYAAGESAPLSV